MEFKNYEEKARYYELLTRQYRECENFLQALKFDNKEPTDYSGIKINSFDNCDELEISTPARNENEISRMPLVYKVNLSKDLGMDLTNAELTIWLIKEVEQRMRVIEDELRQVFWEVEEENIIS
ncbi:hypothetical protein HIU97_03785 [Enterococcus casseliflavus]|uniref:hypothetical protein n=1 Tax=Enterococcus casseliflavus TaxID=37734 RepID=UPI001C4601A2|nr:hypothetical protein [Enterococcus casseliflavus]MBV6373864.1 hypothetical protein [Enterococcus casseliflavus]